MGLQSLSICISLSQQRWHFQWHLWLPSLLWHWEIGWPLSKGAEPLYKGRYIERQGGRREGGREKGKEKEREREGEKEGGEGRLHSPIHA